MVAAGGAQRNPWFMMDNNPDPDGVESGQGFRRRNPLWLLVKNMGDWPTSIIALDILDKGLILGQVGVLTVIEKKADITRTAQIR